MADLASTRIFGNLTISREVNAKGDVNVDGSLLLQGNAVATENYADTQASNAETNANNYTDSQSGISSVSVTGDGNSSIDVSVNGNDGSSQSNSTSTSHTHGYADLPNDVATEGYANSAESSAKSYADNTFLGKTEKATDSDKLDGKHASEFAGSGHTHGYSDLPSDVATEGYADTQASSAEDSAKSYTDSNAWKKGGNAGNTIFVQSSEPSSPVEGDLWVDTSS